MFALPPVLAESNWIAPLVFAAGVGLLTWLMLRKTFKRLGKRSRAGSGPYLKKQRRPDSTWDGTKQDANARFDRQQVELHELARDLNGQIDSKLMLFRELVAKSEQQVVRLEELLEQAEHRSAK